MSLPLGSCSLEITCGPHTEIQAAPVCTGVASEPPRPLSGTNMAEVSESVWRPRHQRQRPEKCHGQELRAGRAPAKTRCGDWRCSGDINEKETTPSIYDQFQSRAQADVNLTSAHHHRTPILSVNVNVILSL